MIIIITGIWVLVVKVEFTTLLLLLKAKSYVDMPVCAMYLPKKRRKSTYKQAILTFDKIIKILMSFYIKNR